MKKIISYVLIAILLITSLFVLTACGNKGEDGTKPSKEVEKIYENAETCELNDKWNGLNVKFAYPKDKGFETDFTDKAVDYQRVTLTSKETVNCEMEVSFDAVYTNEIAHRQENYADDTEKYTGFEEIEVAGFKGYTVNITDYSGTEKYVFLMLARNEAEEEDSAKAWYALDINIEKYSSSSSAPEFDAVEYYNSEDFQNLLKSIIFTKTEAFSVDGVLGDNRDLAVKNLTAPEGYTVAQYPDTNGVMSSYLKPDGKYNGSGAYFRVYSMEGIDPEKFGTLDKVIEYYSSDTFKYTYEDGKAGNLDVKIEHRPSSTTTSDKYAVWDSGYFVKDGKPYNFLYYRYEDVPEEIGTQLIDDVLAGMFLVTEE